jgi:hypothetical protein
MGRANRYLGARNFSRVIGIGRDAYGTWYKPKPTVIEKLGGRKVVRRIRYSKGDVWGNPVERCSAKEYKSFYDPKSFGGS